MADRAKRAEPKAAVPTAYVVLERVLLRDGEDDPMPSAVWAPVLNQTTVQGPDGSPRVFMARDQDAAIRQYTEPDDAEAREGTWKAVALSSWKGGHTTRRKYVTERLPIEEAL